MCHAKQGGILTHKREPPPGLEGTHSRVGGERVERAKRRGRTGYAVGFQGSLSSRISPHSDHLTWPMPTGLASA